MLIHQNPKLLLHICCAPDLTWPFVYLKDYFELYLYWYNPNIHPEIEHKKRYKEYIKFMGLQKGEYKTIDSVYNPKDFFDKVKWLEKEPEGGSRCSVCFDIRMQEAAFVADKHNIEYYTTTLLISPKKDIEKLKKTGEFIKTESKFLFFNFRKNDGYKKACKLTKDNKIRRQNYCGCSYSIEKSR